MPESQVRCHRIVTVGLVLSSATAGLKRVSLFLVLKFREVFFLPLVKYLCICFQKQMISISIH